jgi:hypothetical protein
MNTVYCVVCGIDSETAKFVCESCAFIYEISEDFVPVTCQDSECYLLPNGEMNLDGDCEHSDQFHELLELNY